MFAGALKYVFSEFFFLDAWVAKVEKKKTPFPLKGNNGFYIEIGICNTKEQLWISQTSKTLLGKN